jgi:hypothetical protein
MKNISWILFILSFSVHAYVGIELASPQARFEENEAGTPRPFINAPSLDWKLFYQHNSESRYTWGVSYHSQSIDLSKGNSGLTFDKTSFTRSQAVGYLAIGSKKGWFARVGLHYTNSPYFYENPTADPNRNIIAAEMATRIDPFILGGIYYKTGFGGGQVTLKFMSLANVEVDDQKLSGTGSEIYFSMFLNKGQNFGVFFRYLNEFSSGDYDFIYDSRSIGIIARF